MDQSESLARLVDRIALIELKCAFARAADAGSPDDMVASFAAEAVAVYDPAEPLRGRAVIRDWYAAKLGLVVASSHHVSNFEVGFASPTEATLRCYLYSWQRFSGDSGLPDRHRWARYVDSWRRERDGWQLTALRLIHAGESPSGPGERLGEYRNIGF